MAPSKSSPYYAETGVMKTCAESSYAKAPSKWTKSSPIQWVSFLELNKNVMVSERILTYHVKHHITVLSSSDHQDIFAGAVGMARIQNGGEKGGGGHSYETLLNDIMWPE